MDRENTLTIPWGDFDYESLPPYNKNILIKVEDKLTSQIDIFLGYLLPSGEFIVCGKVLESRYEILGWANLNIIYEEEILVPKGYKVKTDRWVNDNQQQYLITLVNNDNYDFHKDHVELYFRKPTRNQCIEEIKKVLIVS